MKKVLGVVVAVVLIAGMVSVVWGQYKKVMTTTPAFDVVTEVEETFTYTPHFFASTGTFVKPPKMYTNMFTRTNVVTFDKMNKGFALLTDDAFLMPAKCLAGGCYYTVRDSTGNLGYFFMASRDHTNLAKLVGDTDVLFFVVAKDKVTVFTHEYLFSRVLPTFFKLFELDYKY
jgi:hypothetical protein